MADADFTMMEALMELCQEKHIDQLYLLDRLEAALAETYARVLKLDWGAKVTIDRTTGKIYVYRLEPIDDSMDEEGNFTEYEEIDVTPKDVSRLAAQTAKAEINAIVRNAAREQIYEEFSGRVGDLINGTVLQSTPDFTIVKIREGVEAELPHFDQRRYPDERNERPAGERYLHNQHLKAVIIDVREESGPSKRCTVKPVGRWSIGMETSPRSHVTRHSTRYSPASPAKSKCTGTPPMRRSASSAMSTAEPSEATIHRVRTSSTCIAPPKRSSAHATP